MRETQYIGLTKRAQDYVEGLNKLDSDQSISGMFDEEIPLKRWDVPQDYKSEHHPKRCIREVVQATPWSSGMMIFTCLELYLANGINDPEVGKIKMLQWVDDPTVGDREYDEETGRFWV